MSANDELPRSLTLAVSTVGATVASITFPATPGIAWVLTDVSWNTWLTNAASAPVATSVSAGAVQLGEQLIPTAAANFTSDAGGWTGKIAGAPGAALTVSFNANGAGVNQQLIATAYPI